MVRAGSNEARLERRSAGRRLAAGLAAGAVLDQLVRDPRRHHPVALFGTAAVRLERLVWADRRWNGVAYVAACVGSVAAGSMLLDRLAGRCRPLFVIAATWTVLGGRSLTVEAAAVARHLDDRDLPEAKTRLTNLVGRDTTRLDEPGISRAAIESVAENTCDAVVAPLVWGAFAGAPGLLAYRAINTLDAMVGHHSDRYERFGWAAARSDDVANYLPARLTAALIAVVAPAAGGSQMLAWRATRRWGRSHPSPNAGMSEAAFAGALGLQLGGRNVYAGRVEDRPVLGDGRVAHRDDIGRAVRLCQATTAAAVVMAAAIAIRGRR